MRKLILALCLIALAQSSLLNGPSAAQVGLGSETLGIHISDRKGKAIAGAHVYLELTGERTGQGPAPVATDGKGKAAFAELAPGTWQIEIEHPEYLAYVAVLSLERGRKPRVITSFLQAGGGSLAPMRVKLGKASPQDASAPLPPAAIPESRKARAKVPAPTLPAPSSVAAEPTAEQEPAEITTPAVPQEAPVPSEEPTVTPTALEMLEEEDAPVGTAPAEESTIPEEPPVSEVPSTPEPPAPEPVILDSETPEPSIRELAQEEPPVPEPSPEPPAAPRAEIPEPSPPEVEVVETPQQVPQAESEPEGQPADLTPPAPEADAVAVLSEKPAHLEEPEEPEPVAAEPQAPVPTTPEPIPSEPPVAPPVEEPAASEPSIEVVQTEEPAISAPEDPVIEPSRDEMPPVLPTPREPTPVPTLEPPAPVPSEPAVAAEEETPVETAEEAPAPEPPPSVLPAAKANPAPIDEMKMVRSQRDGSCADCRDGEWALSSTRLAAVAAAGSGGCARETVAAFDEAMRGLTSSIQLELSSFLGPAADGTDNEAIRRVEPDIAERTREILAPFTDAPASCQVVGVVLPKSVRFVGFKYEVADSTGSGECVPGQDCRIGHGRWLGRPVVEKGPSSTVVYGVYENSSSDHERLARLIVYFRAPHSSWRPSGYSAPSP